MRAALLKTLILQTALFGLVFAGGEPIGRDPAIAIRYVGSSTVAIFLRDAERVYPRVSFQIDTRPESAGGEKDIIEGKTDFAGIAHRPRLETLRAGVAATLIGRDAIAVIVNARNSVTDISLSQLRAVFAGRVRNWKELDGPDLPIEPFVVGAESATRQVFREVVLGEENYGGGQEVRPDRDIVEAVKKTPGGIGQISFSFLNTSSEVRAVAVGGEEPTVTNFDYPIARPLYLLWREGNPDLEAFIEWTQTPEGQRVVLQHFVGIRVLGSVPATPEAGKTGTLIVYTETYPVYDGGIYYYPHRPYEILSRHGLLIRRILNHRGENDEHPMRVSLRPGTYLIRPQTSRGDRPEFFVRIESGKTTEVYVEELLRERK